jgi:hypothetical protein
MARIDPFKLAIILIPSSATLSAWTVAALMYFGAV